jgi:hypothetical protein
MVNKALDVTPSNIKDKIFNSWEFIVSKFMGCVLDTILELGFWDGHSRFIRGDAGGRNLVTQILGFEILELEITCLDWLIVSRTQLV